MCMFWAALMILGLAACGAKTQDPEAKDGFRPALDTSVSCHISVAGGYNNF